jgi:hypothetical protein
MNDIPIGLSTSIEESVKYEDRWANVFASIEDGTLLSDEERKCLSAQISCKGKRVDEIAQMKNLAVGEHMWISSSWTYEFYLYHSPSKGLLLVYNGFTSLSGSNYGWYSTSVERLSSIFYEEP